MPKLELIPKEQAATYLFNALDRQAICDSVSTLRDGISCTISPQFTYGSTHLFIQLSFADGVFWVARLNMWIKEARDKGLEKEVRVLQLVRGYTKIPVPEVYAWNPGPENVFRTPFVLMQAVNGQKLTLKKQVYEQFKYKILDQMASILIQLSTLQFQLIGDIESPEYCESASENEIFYKTSPEFYDYYINKHLEAYESVPQDQQEKHMAENRLCRRLVRGFEYSSGPFPLTVLAKYGRSSKVLVDDKGNIVALLDWAVAACPWEIFAEFPEVIRTRCVDYSHNTDLEWKDKRRGQRYFIQALRKYERDRKLPGIVSYLVGSEDKIVVGAVLEGHNSSWWNKWMKILEAIEIRKKESSYVPGSISFDDIRKLWAELDRMHAVVVRSKVRH